MCCVVLLLLHRLAFGQCLPIAAIALPGHTNSELSTSVFTFTCIVLPGLVSCPHATVSGWVLRSSTPMTAHDSKVVVML